MRPVCRRRRAAFLPNVSRASASTLKVSAIVVLHLRTSHKFGRKAAGSLDEELAHRRFLINRLNGLREKRGYAQDLDAFARLGFGEQRDRIGGNNLLERRLLDVVNGVPRKNAVRAASEYPNSAFALQGPCTLGKRTTRPDHVINNQAGLAFNFADDIEHLDYVSIFPALVNNGQRYLQLLGKGPGPFDAAGIRRNNHQVLKTQLAEICHRDGRGV